MFEQDENDKHKHDDGGDIVHLDLDDDLERNPTSAKENNTKQSSSYLTIEYW